MLTFLVRLSLAAEIAAYAGIGAWLHATREYPAWQLLFAAIAAALALRLVLVLATNVLGWLNRSPRAPGQRLGIAGTWRLLAGEYRALLADNLFFLPFEALALRPDPRPAPSARVPIVLVHGYLSNRGYFRPMVRWLEARGVAPIHAPNFTSVFSTIEQFAFELDREIEHVLAGSGHAKVVLVCHSMGGLAARGYLRSRGEARVARLVTIASPHHGTRLAALGIGKHARQMRPGSEFLAALDAFEAAKPPRVPALSIYTTHDNLVSPQDTARLDWARNVVVGGLGHIDIIASDRLFPLLLEELRAAGAAP